MEEDPNSPVYRGGLHQIQGCRPISVRYTLALMICLCMFTVFMMRINLSVGIVAMTNNYSNPSFPTLPWDTKVKSVVLSSYFWGYIILQVPAALFCQRYGPKYLLFTAILTCGLVTLLTPCVAIHLSWHYVVALRVVQGFGQGCLYPCIYSLVSTWAPPLERNRFVSFLFAGLQSGTVVTLLGTGLLAAGPGGWPSVFYISGVFGILWALLWLFLGANSPIDHSYITEHERNMILVSTNNTADKSKILRIPWCSIFTSVPMWALLLCHFCENWGFYTILMLMPSYLNSALNVDIKNNGIISAVPYLLMWVFTIIFGRLADYILTKDILAPNTAKKMWNTIGMWGSALGYLGLTLTSCTSIATAVLTITISVNFGTQFGFFTNHLDLSPNFACILIGITNCLSNTASFLAPLTAGVLLNNEKDIKQWDTVFQLCALIFFIGNLVFIIFGSTDVQSWNDSLKLEDRGGSCGGGELAQGGSQGGSDYGQEGNQGGDDFTVFVSRMSLDTSEADIQSHFSTNGIIK